MSTNLSNAKPVRVKTTLPFKHNTIKKGDTVECLNTFGQVYTLTKYKLYLVLFVKKLADKKRYLMMVDDEDMKRSYLASRFKKVDDKSAIKKGDFVKCIDDEDCADDWLKDGAFYKVIKNLGSKPGGEVYVVGKRGEMGGPFLRGRFIKVPTEKGKPEEIIKLNKTKPKESISKLKTKEYKYICK